MWEKNTKAARREEDGRHFIVWIRDYMDDRARKTRQTVVVAGEPPPGFDHFVGIGKIDLITLKGATVAPITFPIPGAANVVETFARWDAEYEKAVENTNRKIFRASRVTSRLPAAVDANAIRQ